MPRYNKHDRFVRWWTQHNEQIAEQTADKCAEYGSHDLYGIGHNIAKITNTKLSNAQAFELGCLFYLVGKVERAMSAAQRGDTASDDTWLDIAVYAQMVQAHRAGVWFNQIGDE